MVFFSEMAEYSHTFEGSSYRFVQTPMNWLDAQVNAVALSIFCVIFQNRCLVQVIQRFSTSITDIRLEEQYMIPKYALSKIMCIQHLVSVSLFVLKILKKK